MKKIFYLIVFILFQTNSFSKNIVYLDIQYIIDNSSLGIHYKKNINKIKNQNIKKLKIKEDQINKKETQINNQKNILSKDEIQKQISELNELLKKFQIERNKLNNEILEQKKNYSSKILKLLNPLLTDYVEKNGITLVIEKKNILVGINSLDITPSILKIFNDETKKEKMLNEN
tara:strand:- start:2325 stop:2846 length:522 start_codon:yes stop_codon:yes gene_type:complete